VHPIAALQTEYSLWSRDPEDQVCRRRESWEFAFVAYSPLGRGFLTGQIKKFEDLAADDYRRTSPRFMEKIFKRNLELVERVIQIAKEKGCTAGQLALRGCWRKARTSCRSPEPKRRKYLEENAGADAVKLRRRGFAAPLMRWRAKGAAAGHRYNEVMMKLSERVGTRIETRGNHGDSKFGGGRASC